MEQFKKIDGFDYEISNLGNVKCTGKNNGLIRKIRIDRKGYFFIDLGKKNKKYRFRVHRLIANAFISNPENKPYINHKDGNKKNNSIANLEWCSAKENIRHAFDIGLMVGKSGGDNVKSKKVKQYTKEGEFIAEYNGVRAAGRYTGINQASIGKSAQGLRPSAGGYVWKYE